MITDREQLVLALFVRHQTRIKGFISSLMGDFAAVPDVLQETFLVVQRKAGEFEPGSNKFKEDRDELAWEWWSWYGDKDSTQETHPNSWVLDLAGAEFHPKTAYYRGEASTHPDKGANNGRGESRYSLKNAQPRRLEKYLVGHNQWRPDSVNWCAALAAEDPGADLLGLFTHSTRLWRNPNILPLPQGVTLRTGANDMRLWTEAQGSRLRVECPIDLGRRVWALRPSTLEETFGKEYAFAGPFGGSPSPETAPRSKLSQETVRRVFGLDIVRHWITDWEMKLDYPRLFIQPKDRDAFYARLKGKGIGNPGNSLDTFLRNQDQAGFDRDHAAAVQQAGGMIANRFAVGCDITSAYPDWMMAYISGIAVANTLDILAGHPLCMPEQARALKKKLAILTDMFVSKDSWPDRGSTTAGDP